MLLGAMRRCGSVRGRGPELCGRRARAREMFARVAGFPTVKTLDGFDFGFATGVPRRQIHELAGLAFIERAENVVFLGPPAPASRGPPRHVIDLPHAVLPSASAPRVSSCSQVDRAHAQDDVTLFGGLNNPEWDQKIRPP
jgi:hypothetical protein